MARPIKDGVSYWPFDVDMLEDRKFKLIRAEFGIKGAYIALVILNSVYKDNGYYKRWDDDDCLMMSEDVGDGCSPQLVRAVLNGCVRRGLFDESRFQMFGILTSAGIQRRFLQMVKNSREKIVFIKEYLLIDLHDQGLSEGVLNKVVLKTGFPEENPYKTEENPHKTGENSRKKKEIEKEIERDNKYTVSSASASGELSAKEVVELFNRLCPSLPKVIALTDARRTAIRKAGERLGGFENFEEFFKRIEASDFLTGRNQIWKNCGFDWCLKAGNIVKIQEGQYDNKGSSKPAVENSEYEEMVQRCVPKYKKKKEEVSRRGYATSESD